MICCLFNFICIMSLIYLLCSSTFYPVYVITAFHMTSPKSHYFILASQHLLFPFDSLEFVNPGYG